MFDALNRLIAVTQDRSGVTDSEYALLASLAGILLIGTLGALGSDIASSFTPMGANSVTTVPATK